MLQDGFQYRGYTDSFHYAELYVNPTQSEISDILKDSEIGVRLTIDTKMNIYAYKAEVLHEEFKRIFHIEEAYTLIFDRGFPDFLICKTTQVTLADRIRELFPSVKSLMFDNGDIILIKNKG